MSNVITITARIIDAEKVKASIGAIGDVTGKTAKEVQAHSKAMVAAEKEIEAAFKTQAAELKAATEAAKLQATQQRAAAQAQKEAAAAAREAARQVAEVSKEASSASMSFGKLATAFGVGFTGAQLLQQGIAKLGEAFQFSVEQAAKYESSMRTLQIVSERTGGNFSANKQLVDEFSDAISSPAAAAQAVRVFQTMNLPMETQRDLIRSIRDGIVAMGGDVNEQMPAMALAIKRQEGAMLDNMGVVSTIETMYKEYAKTIGTTSDKLTQQQREQAVVNNVLKELKTYAGVAENALDSYQGSVNNLNSSLQSLGTTAGEKVNPHLKFLNNQLANTLRLMGQAMSNPINDFIPEEPASKNDLGLPANFKPKYSLPAGMQPLRSSREEQEYQERQATAQKQAREQQEKQSKQHAEEQKRQRQQLQDDLATIGKTGRELELAQEEIQHRKQLEIAKGNHRNLELEAERHRKVLQGINAKYPATVTPGVNSSAPGLNISMGLGVTGLSAAPAYRGGLGVSGSSLLSGYSISGGQPLPGANLPNADELARTVGDGADKIEKAAEKGGDYIADSIGDALVSGSALVANSIRTGEAPSAGDVTRSGGSIAGGIAGFMLGGPAGASIGAQVGQAAGDIIGSFFDRHDKEARETAEIQRKAAETQMEAAKSAVESAQTAYERSQDASLRVKVARGEMTEDQAAITGQENSNKGTITKLRQDLEKSGVSSTDFDLALNLIQSRNGGTMTKEQSLNVAANWIGANNAQAIARTLEGNDALLEALKIEIANKEKDRVGSSPQNPIYTETKITNFKDMVFFAPGEMFRATGPGTRRDDGMKGRAVNTRGD